MESANTGNDAIGVALRVGAAIEAVGGAYFVGGSLASSLQGEPRATNDIDMVLELPLGRIIQLKNALGEDFEVDIDMLRDALLHGRCCNLFYLPSVTKVGSVRGWANALRRERVLSPPPRTRPEHGRDLVRQGTRGHRPSQAAVALGIKLLGLVPKQAPATVKSAARAMRASVVCLQSDWAKREAAAAPELRPLDLALDNAWSGLLARLKGLGVYCSRLPRRGEEGGRARGQALSVSSRLHAPRGRTGVGRERTAAEPHCR